MRSHKRDQAAVSVIVPKFGDRENDGAGQRRLVQSSVAVLCCAHPFDRAGAGVETCLQVHGELSPRRA